MQSKKMDRSTTKMGSFPPLNPIQSSGREEIPAPWDSETDHLLSYFLGDNGASNSNANSSVQEFGSSTANAERTGATALRFATSFSDQSRKNTITKSESSSFTDDEAPPQPRTPAVQFYAPSSSSRMPSVPIYSSSQGQPTTVNSSLAHPSLISSSPLQSLAPIAASLVYARPNPHGHPKNNSTNTTNTAFANDSSISPITLSASTPQENLMLPSDLRNPISDNNVPAAADATDPIANKLNIQDGQNKWIKRIKDMAKTAANHGILLNTPHFMVNFQQQQPQPHHQNIAAMQQQPTRHQSNQSTPAVVANISQPTNLNYGYPTTTGYMPNLGPTVQSTVMYTQPVFSPAHHHVLQPAGESEEKRARRLERNRESARKSRRRKKDKQFTLEKKVQNLHKQIEKERRKQINAMLPALKRRRTDEISKSCESLGKNPKQEDFIKIESNIVAIIKSTGFGNNTSGPITEFQYNTLKQILLPRYQNFLLWLANLPESYFTAGKEEYGKREGKQVFRISSGRVSSKQIGEDLKNGWEKMEEDRAEKYVDDHNCPEKVNSGTVDGEQAHPTSCALDAARTWPFLCHELTISVDQEERIIQCFKRVQNEKTTTDRRSQLAAAIKMASSLSKAVESQCASSSLREDRALIEILNPDQLLRYQQWLLDKKENYDFVRSRIRSTAKDYPLDLKEASLCDVCKRLEKLLRIPTKDGET